MPTKVPKNTSLSQPSPLPQLQNSDGSSNEDQPKINSRRTSNSSDSSEDSLTEEVLNKTTSKPSTNPNPSMPSQKLDSTKTRRKKLEEDLKSHQAAAACYEEDMNTSTDTNVLAQAKTLRKNQLDAAQETESELSSMDESSSDSEKESKPDHPDTEPPAPETLKQSKPFDKPPPKPKQKPKIPAPTMKLRSASDIHMKKTPFDPSFEKDNKSRDEEQQKHEINEKLRALYSPITNKPKSEAPPETEAKPKSSTRITRSSNKPPSQPTKDPTTNLQKDNYPLDKHSTSPIKLNDPPGKGKTSGDIKLMCGVKSLASMYPEYVKKNSPPKKPTFEANTLDNITKTKSRPPSPHPSSKKAKTDTQKKHVSPPTTRNPPRDPTPTPTRKINTKSNQTSKPLLPDDLKTLESELDEFGRARRDLSKPAPKKHIQQRADSLLMQNLSRIKDFSTIPDQKYLRQPQLKYHQASYKPPSPKPILTKTDSDITNDRPTTSRPTRPNPSHPDQSHKNQNPRAKQSQTSRKFLPSREQIQDMRSTGETTAHIETPSVNYLPSGADITLQSRTTLPMNKFSHFLDENFVVDPYEFRPAELLSLTTHNATDGFALNSLQWWFEHPHHAMISFATGKKGRGLLLHTPSVFKIPPSLCENKEARELTAVEGSQNIANLRSIDSSLNMFQLIQVRAPTPSYFASLGFSKIDDVCPDWHRKVINICPSIALPSKITSALTNTGNSTSAKDVFNIVWKIIHKEYREHLDSTGYEPSLTKLDKQGIPFLPGEEPCLNIDEDFLWISEKYHHILALCWVSHRHSIPAIPNQFDNSRNPNSKTWMLKFSDLVQKGIGNYSSVFQDPSRLQNATISNFVATPKLPLFPTRPNQRRIKTKSYLPTIDENSDTDTPPELPPEDLFPSNYNEQFFQKPNPKPDDLHPYDWFHPEEKKDDDPSNDWSQLRGPGSKRPARFSNLTPRQLEHLKKSRVENPTNPNDFAEAESCRPDTPSPQCSPMIMDYNKTPNELNSPSADKTSRDDYANAVKPTTKSETAKLIEILTRSVERQTNIQQMTLEQNEKHFEARENKNISTATRLTHLNNSTIDGINPATELTELDTDLLKCKNVFDAKDIIELFLRTNDCTTIITLELTKALMRGKWIPDDRFVPQGLSIFQIIASPSQAMDEIRGSELERAHDDYKLNKKITPQQEEALMNTRICIPRQMHYLSDQIKIMYYLTVGLTGPESKITEAMLLWWNFVDTNKTLLINLQLNGHKLLPVQIAHQIEQTRITYFSQGQSKVPDPSILNNEQMMNLILGGNHQITICRSIMNHIESTGRKQTHKARNDQPNGNDTTTPEIQRGRPVFHSNQLPQLRVTRTTYRNALMPALRNNAFLMPEHNNMEECAKFCFLGQCHDHCPRKANHIQVLNGSNRAKSLKKSLEQAQNWYQTNKNPGSPDFQ